VISYGMRVSRSGVAEFPERCEAINDKCPPPTCGGVCEIDSTANMHVQHHVTLMDSAASRNHLTGITVQVSKLSDFVGVVEFVKGSITF